MAMRVVDEPLTEGQQRTVHDALFEALTEPLFPDATAQDHAKRRSLIHGMRYVAGLLGMEEGSTEYVWPETGTKL
jgi:hypothetical protein